MSMEMPWGGDYVLSSETLLTYINIYFNGCTPDGADEMNMKTLPMF